MNEVQKKELKKKEIMTKDYSSMTKAYDMWLKQLGGSISTKNPDPCGPNCHCMRYRSSIDSNK